MWAVYKKKRLGASDIIATTENEYQAKKVTNVLNKMSLGNYVYKEAE